MTRTTLVTGASGQVGLHLVDALVARGDRVRAFVLPGDHAFDGRDDVVVARGDVRDLTTVREASRGATSVFHLAAIVSTSSEPSPLLEAVNVEGARNVAVAAREVGARMVHFSSFVVFDPAPRDRPLDETRRRLPGGSPYTVSKLRGEEAVRDQIALGLDAVVVHPSVIVGPHETHHAAIATQLIGRHRAGTLPATMAGAGFDLVDVEDVVAGAIAAEQRGRRGESYLLSGRWYDMDELLAISARVCGRPPPRLRVPLWLARASLPLVSLSTRLLGRDAPFDQESLVQSDGNRSVSHAKASRELGYRPRPIDAAVARAHAWLDESRRLQSDVRGSGPK